MTATLISRLEEAKGPDRELDAEIALAVLSGEIEWRQAQYTGESYPVRKYESRDHVLGFGRDPVESYTASVDAALTLVPSGWSVLFAWNGETSICNIHLKPLGNPSGLWPDAGKSTNPAIAICIAALKAREVLRAQVEILGGK